MPETSVRVAGCDLGKASAVFVVGTSTGPGLFQVERTEVVDHHGEPLEAFRTWYRGLDGIDAMGATGLYADELVEPVLAGLPEDACLQAALAHRPDLDGPLNLISIGARGYSVLTRDDAGHVQVLENDKCSSGTGETMVKIAGRFGLGIEEADRLARAAPRAIPISARCSVFAKSEMTHFGNQGRPADELFRGYFTSVATYVAALLARARVDGPVRLIGGGSRIGALVDALGEVLGQPVEVAEDALQLEALGAAAMAAEAALAGAPGVLPEDPAALIRPHSRRFTALPPARNHRQRVTRLEAVPVPDGAEREPTVLGLDLGSTGSKAALTSLADGQLVLDLYDRTRGNPVGAAQRLIRTLLDRVDADVRAIALTGSGREAAATVLRAAFPEHAERIVVHNEIVAHATAAIRCDTDGGSSLSVVEIGGQDAKFIQIRGGQIVESDMNKACSAGTGSFLEEQAVFHGVTDIEEFTDLAQRAERPPDLGQMCTVYVADAAAEALAEGYDTADLFGAFQYSVIHNYLHRVMGQRTFGERVFLQGKPATGPALAWTLAAVSGRDVVVPPNPGAMGAWGIGLLARDELEQLAGAPPLALEAALEARVLQRSEFQCRDRDCATLCVIEKTSVAVGDRRESVLSGGACPKYEISGLGRPKLPKETPSALDERAALLAPYLADRPGERLVGIPEVGACVGVIPLLVTFVEELGLGVVVLRSDARSLARGEERCYSFDACAPAKIAHGVVDTGDPEVETLLFPKLLSLQDREGCQGRTCPMEQGLPEMVREMMRARGRSLELVHPNLSLAEGPRSATLERQLAETARRLGAPPTRVRRAIRRAFAAQQRFDAGLAEIGRRTLAHGREHGIPVVLLAGALHVIHDRAVNAGIPQLLRQNGVLALPMDCYPIPDGVDEMPRIYWADSRRVLRTALAARSDGAVYPLMLTAFGCGPASFVEQIFSSLMEGYPHTCLESDGHGGAAGYVTRVQAFLHAVRQHDRRPSPVPPERLRWLAAVADGPISKETDARLVMFSMSDRTSAILAAVYRSYGLDAVASGPTDAAAYALGRQDCSGKECLPYQMIWGSFRQHLEQHPPQRRTVLMQITGEGMCRNCMFSLKDQINLRHHGLDDRVGVRHVRVEPDLGWPMLARMWSSTVAWDIFHQLSAYYRPLLGEDVVMSLYLGACTDLERLVERPSHTSVRGLPGLIPFRRELLTLLDRVSAEFATAAAAAPRDGHHRTVLLTGDIFLRLDAYSSDDLVRRLNARGLRVIVEPASALAEYMAQENLSELIGLPKGRLDNTIVKNGMEPIRAAMFARVGRRHPWLPPSDIKAVLRTSREILDVHPQGEAPVTVGSALHHWREGYCDGVVVVSPWGCGPALIAESLLRHQREIPLLFVYSDGTPLDERRLNAYAFRLRRTPSRVASPPP